MKITRSLISAASAIAIFAGTATPAFAYVRAVPPVATTTLRQRAEIRELYADAFSSILELANMNRGAAMPDTTGRAMLARAQVRAAQRNYRRHVLGYLRGVDYRILNTAGRGATSPYAITAGNSNLPLSLVTTGGETEANTGSWGWDKPTRRDIRENMHYRVNDRDRNVLDEIANSSR